MIRLRRYIPLIVLALIAILAATALMLGMQTGATAWMHFFMGFLFCQFAMLKLFHLTGFVEGFQKYDLLAKHIVGYAYLYPFIELALGLAYLAFFYPLITNIVTICILALGAISVIRALQAGLDTRCACMGTILDVPLSTVTLSEDIVMGLMAIVMLHHQ